MSSFYFLMTDYVLESHRFSSSEGRKLKNFHDLATLLPWIINKPACCLNTVKKHNLDFKWRASEKKAIGDWSCIENEMIFSLCSRCLPSMPHILGQKFQFTSWEKEQEKTMDEKRSAPALLELTECIRMFKLMKVGQQLVFHKVFTFVAETKTAQNWTVKDITGEKLRQHVGSLVVC